MHKYLSSSLNSVVTLDLENSWAARSLHEALKNHQLDARFQQKQIQEKEEKLLRLYENQQQRAFERVGRGSAGSNSSISSSTGGGKVRQMFDERRQRAGIDKSYPLEPLKSKSSTYRTVTSVKSTSVSKSVMSQVSRNGRAVANNRREVVASSTYNNNNGDEGGYHHQDRYSVSDSVDNRFSRARNGARDIVELMNSHNLGDEDGGLDAEEMPQIGFDEIDDLVKPSFTGKLANVGGKLPSEVKKQAAAKSNSLGKTFRKDTKPIVKRTVKPAPPTNSTPVLPAPSKTTSPQTMQQQSAKSTTVKKAPVAAMKSPSTARPSAKQSAKSPVTRDDLAECRYCSRRFATDRLQVHEGICGKTAKKKRKVYDATKHRVEGTELETYSRKGFKNPTTSSKSTAGRQAASGKKTDWRKTHEEFINAIRSAKQAQAHLAKGGKLSDLPPPPPSSNPDYVQCPHCGRKFNESAAERHIPKCASYSFNKPKPGTATTVKGKSGR